MSQRQLVVGGAGFIGSALVRELTARGPVSVLDDLSTGSRESIAEVSGVDLVVGSILDEAAVEHAVHDVDVVYNLACLGVRHSIHSPVANHQVNATGVLNLLKTARAARIGRFVHVSSSEVYGTAVDVPIGRDHRTFPHTVYGASKLAGEAYARAFHSTHGLPVVVLRPFNAYGPRSHYEGDSGEVIPRFLVRAMNGLPPVIFGDGSNTRDFTYVTDVARAIAAAGVADGVVGETLCIGSGSEVSIRELAEIVIQATGRDLAPEYSEPRPGDLPRLLADASSAGTLLSWEPTVGLREGIRSLLDWHTAVNTDWAEALVELPERNWEIA